MAEASSSPAQDAGKAETKKVRGLPVLRRFTDERGQHWVETKQPVVPGKFGKVKFIRRVIADPDKRQPNLKRGGFRASRPGQGA